MRHQLAALLTQLAAANTPISVTSSTTPNSGGQVTSIGNGTPPPTLTLNGNNPATWTLNTSWQDNLGALFTYSGTSTGAVTSTIYSTSTIETTQPGSTTIDYWAQVPTSGRWLHATREVVIPAAANDNPQPLSPTGTTTSTTTTP